MVKMKITQINLNIIILFFLFILKNETIISNPKVIMCDNYYSSCVNPIVDHSNEMVNFYFSRYIVSQNITSREVITRRAFCRYNYPYILIRSEDTSNALSIYSYQKDCLISITNNNCDFLNISDLVPLGTIYSGYINETSFVPLGNYQIMETDEVTGLRCKSLDNEKILYGKESNNIIFSFLKKKEVMQLLTCDMEDYFICNQIINSVYLCAYICSNQLYINAYAYQTVNEIEDTNCTMKKVLSQQVSFMNGHTGVRMVDGDERNSKIICAQNKNEKRMECFLFKYSVDEEQIVNNEIKDESDVIIKIIKTNNIIVSLEYDNKFNFSFPLNENTNTQCIFKESLRREFLLCCGGENTITCGRIDNKCNLIGSFSLTIGGTNSQLDFIVYSSYIILFYMNYKYTDSYEENNFYEYTIILPSCVDKIYSIIPLSSSEDYLYNLVKKEFNTEYYIEFTEIPNDYINLTVNDEIIDTNSTGKLLVDNSKKFNLISINDEFVSSLKIKYNIYISQTFSSKCFVDINILQCYKSCRTCTKSGEESNEENHNCIPNSCNEQYYLDPDIDTKCWNIGEKKSNWYLDYRQNKFFYCNDLCASCDGPLDTNCLSCKSNNILKYLYNQTCYESCPDGTFPKLKATGYSCDPCYETCGTCTELGTINNMKCNTCKENTISFRFNCFFEKNPEEKSFYIPGSTQISSCYEEYDLFILENTYQCIANVPSEGYYLANSRTGLYRHCHSDCRTCRGGHTEETSNCILCLNENLNFFQGNCLENCPIGYYSLEKSDTNIQKRCLSCYSNCKTCDQGEEYLGIKLEKMNCLECKKGLDAENNSIEKYIKIDVNCLPFILYSEEKITIDISEINGNSEVSSIQSCLYFGLSIFYGQYTCIEKPINTYYVLNNEENTGVIKYCDIACSTCYGAPDNDLYYTNCIICADGYYKTEDSETNCILESLIPDNYYKNNDDNIYYKCYTNCETCRRNLDHKADINNMGCLSCKTNYYFVYQTDNCFDNTFLDNNINYYFSSGDNKFHKCYDSCKRCINAGTNSNHNCEECRDNYYFEENTKNCLDFSYLEKGYYFDNFTINHELNESPKFKKCYENCKSCTISLIDDNMNCILCKTDYYKIIDTNNCINDITNKGYYLKNDLAIPCEENCLTCSDGESSLNENNIDNNNNIITDITKNCLSCDENTKNLFLVENINNCEPMDFKSKGFYLQTESNGKKIFHKCYKSCSLCERNREIDPTTHNENHNCLECAQNYHRLLNDENEYNCYGEEMIEKGYRLVRNIWQICHENCDTCTGRPTYDETNTIVINQNCRDCYEGFKFIYQTSNCADNSYLEKGYYFDDIIQKYRECDISCISCEKYSTENEPKCIKCNNDQGYYKAENKPDSRCYNRSTIDEEYVLSIRYDEDGNMYKKWALCYETCLSCTKYGTEEDHACISCLSRHYLIYNTSNCITNNYAINNGYYFNTTYLQFVECDKACHNCEGPPIDDNTNCKQCNYEDNYYPIEGKTNNYCYNNETIEEGYFLNQFTEPYKWSNCYENCATCEFKGTINKMNCLSCRTNLKNQFDKIKLFLLLNGNCIEICPENLFLTKEGDCVSDCPSGTYQFHLDYNFSCVDFCPDKYLISADGKKCELPEFQSYINTSEFKDIISNDIISYVNSSRIIDLDNLQAQIVYSNDLNVDFLIKNKITAISNIEDSLNALKVKYTIPNDEPLIIAIIETKENKNNNLEIKNGQIINLGKDIELVIYDKNGHKLELSNCKNEKVSLMKYIGDLPYIDFNKAVDLSKKGIDVFKESDPFFNDICYPFTSNTSSDVILADRRIDIFQNISFCDSGCNYTGIDYDLMIVNCLCYINSINNDNNKENKGITINNNKNKFPNELHNTNLVLIKCSNLAFDANVIKNNIGFYFSLITLSFEIASIVVFAKNGLKPIKNFMLIFSGIANPPKLKELLSLADINDNNKDNKKKNEIQKSFLINHLLNKKKAKKKQEEIKNEIDDALIVRYSQSDYEDYESNRNSLKENIRYKEYEKKSISESDSESDSRKEKRTRITRKNLKHKKTDKRNNLVNMNEEKPKINKEMINNKKYVHPVDMLDTLTLNKNNKNKNNKNKNPIKGDSSESNFDEDEDKKNTDENYDDNMRKSKKHKTMYNKKEEKEKKSIFSKKSKNKNKNKEKQKEKENKNKDTKHIETYSNKNKKYINNENEKNSNYNIMTNEELSIMDYEEAIKIDKRKWSKIYWDYLIEKNCISNTFISESFINLRTIKINFLCFRLEIIFVLNALFYTDSYISKTYYNNGKLNFFISLPKVLYSFLVCLLVNIFLKLLSNNKNQIYNIIKNKDDKLEYEDLMNKLLSTIKIKLIIFLIIQFIFSFIFLYYITAFCAVYQNSKIYWLFGCLETFAIDMIFSFIVCIFIASLRYFGIRKRIKCFYIFAYILDLLL